MMMMMTNDVALVWSPRNIIQTLKVSLQTAAVGPGGVEILVVIVLLKFLKEKEATMRTIRPRTTRIPPRDLGDFNSRIRGILRIRYWPVNSLSRGM